MRNMKLSGLDLLESMYAEREAREQKPDMQYMKLFVTLNVEYNENTLNITDKICNDIKLKTEDYNAECVGWCDAWRFDTKEEMEKDTN